MIKYKYMIVYSFIFEGQNGIGRVFIDYENVIKTQDDIQRLDILIKDQYEYESVIIIDYKRLLDEPTTKK